MDERTTAIGIDLGTTNSCVAVYKSGSGKVEIIINNEHGHTTTPSYVSFTGDEILIGHNAKEKARRYLRNTIFDVKRLIGREFDDPNVKEDIKQWPFEVINDDNKPKIRVEVNGTFKTYCPEEISAMILRKMKETAETYLGKSVTKAVITVPAYFNDSQRQATKDAATIAGLNVLRIINEPTAAAIAYGFDKKNTKRNVLIFDLGGGTFDVSIFTLNGKNEIFEVKSTKGNTHLGGEDFNQKMVQHFVNEFQRVCEKDYSQNQSVLHSLKTECERVKKILSSAKEASIDVDSFYDGIEEFKITRACFEEMNKELFQSTLDLVEKAIKDAKLDKTQIDDVVLVGGSSRIPKIQKLLEDFFGSEKLKNKINPDEAVAYGAAVQAAILNGDQSKQIEKILLLDVTPLSLGIQDSNDEMNVVIERNTTIPARGKIAWTTSYKNQTEVIISVYEGEFRKASENHMIGQFTLEGLRNVRGTMVDIEIIMDIDANGILKVSATEKSASKRNAISITCKNGRLSKREIQRMIDKAQEDKTTESNEATRVSAKNSLESCLFEIMNTVSNEKFRNKINKTDKKLILDKCTETLHWIDSNSSTKTEQFQLKLKELEDIRAVITAMNVSNVYDPNVRYCNVLNVKKGASKTVIQDSFRLLAGKYHPDKFPGDKRIASWLFKTISDAKESLLYDANKRRRLN